MLPLSFTANLITVIHYKLPKSQLSRLQQVQNSLASIRSLKLLRPAGSHPHPMLSSLAQNHWTHRIYKLLFTYLQSSHNYPTSIPSYSHLCSTSSQYSSSDLTLARPPTSSSIKETDCSFHYAFPCLLWKLEPTPFISLSTSFWYQFLYFPLTYSSTHHFFFVWFITLLIHNFFSFSPPA